MRRATLLLLGVAFTGCLSPASAPDDATSGANFRHEHTFSGSNAEEPFELSSPSRARVSASFRAIGADAAQVCVGVEDARLVLLDPSGDEHWSFAPDVYGITGESTCGEREEELRLLDPGTWSVRYDSAQNVQAYFLIESTGKI